jgi:hypothetical protein
VKKWVTVGNVYEITCPPRSPLYDILPDHGIKKVSLPSYIFEVTDEPVTINPNREQEEKDRQLLEEKSNDHAVDERQITQNIMDRKDFTYYDLRQKILQYTRRGMHKTFEPGLPHQEY